MELNIVRIEIERDEAELFKLFCQYRDDVCEMLKSKVFNFRNGVAMIYRDHDGVLQNIEIKEQTYKRKSKKSK